MVDTKGKYRLVEIGALKPGALFSVSLEMEDEQYRVSEMRLSSQPEYIIGVGIETGCKLGWLKDCPVYVKEGGEMRWIDADHLSERVNNSADTPMQKLYVDALLAGEPTVAESKKPKTNADRIRAMSDEELAEKMGCPYMEDAYDECKFGWHTPTQTCFECKLEWLRQPVKDGDNNGM